MRRSTAAGLTAFASGVAFLCSALLTGPPAQAAPAPQADRIPVIFVHGRNADPGVWGTMKSTFKQSGYSDSELFGWGYDSSRSTNEVLARQFSAYVADVLHQTGAAQVDIVAHSQGGLPTRWFLRFGGGTSVVRDWVSLGGPNHGTNLAWACALWDQGCRDMTPGSYVESHLAAGNQTPGPTRYATFASHCDEFILPNSSVPLPGAANSDAGCLAHNDLLTDPSTAQGVLAFLRQ
ncbi:esterase/lipase family protein [Streptomyces beijiangensis]|uniref:Triacylglycerol lipase n=1 Tax=Streptomyces beijiangensis TaxID=163361 RepID=A0A939FBN0_9ACTN|nr:triacylglycerol lipase [Streptomyces beijiangensis]MBO0515593.1 triacylglycerol lipase [Streptomyces beijiangensis]